MTLAYFHFINYCLMRDYLAAIQLHLTKGNVLGFDKPNMPELSGETRAFDEVIGLNRYSIRRNICSPLTLYRIAKEAPDGYASIESAGVIYKGMTVRVQSAHGRLMPRFSGALARSN